MNHKHHQFWRLHQTDVTLEDEGSIILFRPHTPAVQDWLETHVPADAPWFGGALAVESNYADALLIGLQSDGFNVAYA